ncbi:GDP-mannose 4,6-dehydratase, partial [Aeromonas salmonicida]|uniref:GDP-mannose 4,6-dehydratase n=1 Tax=Aeromonas salmonicida TaxID=645 RepID=UPI002796B8D3
ANIAQGLDSCLYMGNIDSLRDWGHAKDYVQLQWLMLQQEKPEDFVIATGEQYSVRQFILWAAEEMGMQLCFEGKGVEEVAVVVSAKGELAPAVRPGDVILRIDPRYFRPAEVDSLLGDASKAREMLGWKPSISVREMCAEMAAADMKVAQRHALLKKHGFEIGESMGY